MADAGDLFKQVARRWVGQIGAGGVADDSTTTIPLSATTNLPTGTGVVLVIDRVDVNGTATASKEETITGVVSGSNIINCTRGVEGTAQAHSAGAVVEVLVTASYLNDIVNGILVQHDQAGRHTNITACNITASGTVTLSHVSASEINALSYLQNGSPFTGGLVSTTQYAPQGFLINGRISVSVASNNITVAIKGMDGNDPSASNPVYCRIGDTVRTITSALSVTKNAGTNWFNSGGSELATNETDYFVYLGYNATDGVVIGFARIPFARKYGDFNTTSTNEQYCAISTITNAASTDYYEAIGRFAATLSAGAGYTWTVPTFTASNLIQQPIYDTRWLTFSPTFTGFSANPTSPNRYKVCYNTVKIVFGAGGEGTSNGTGLTQTLPFIAPNVSNLSWRYVGRGVDNGGVTAPAMAGITNNTNILTCWKGTEGTNWTGSGTKQWAGLIEYGLQIS